MDSIFTVNDYNLETNLSFTSERVYKNVQKPFVLKYKIL